MFGDADIPFMLQDFGVPVQFGGYSALGLLDDFDERDSFRSDLDQINRIRAVTIQSGSAVTTPFARASTATYTDVNGIVQTAPANVLRNQHYVNGAPTLLYEPVAATNPIKWSRDLTQVSAWAQANGTGLRLQNAVGLDGTANSATTVSDTDAGQTTAYSQATAVPNDGATHCLAFWIKKDTDQTRFPLCQATLSGGTSVIRSCWLNTQTGATQLFSSGSGTNRVVDGGLWWIVELTVNNNSSGNTSLIPGFYPARATVFGVQNLAAQGSCVVGQVDVNLNATAFSSPIFTTVAAVTRAADIDQMFAATQNGYTRQLGSFITDGFKIDQQVNPLAFASNPKSIITGVTDLALSVAGPRMPEAAVAGRQLYVGLPGLKRGSALTVNGAAVKVRDILVSGDGALSQLHVVTP